ncbi:hypothetical protein LXL04_001624 [Taraxacum kok-saghyz]
MRDISFTNPNGENRDQLLHKAGFFSYSSPPKLNESIKAGFCEKVSFNIGFFAVFIHLIMEDNNDLIGDIPDHEMDDIDDGTQVFGSDSEDGYDDNSSDDLDSSTDSEQEIQTTVKRKSKRKRGLTRLPKVRTEHTNSGGKKKRVKFDELGRFAGKYRAQLPSFLGDLVREKVGLSVLNWRNVTKEVRDKLWEEITRYYEIEDTRRKYVMTRLGALLRNFRRKLYAKYIEPNLKNPSKLAVIPKRYRTIILNQEHWNAFVTYTQSQNFKDVSKKTIIARSKSIYDHRMGRGGYTALREKLVQKQVIDKHEMPPRSFMWYKGRENKAGEIVDDGVQVIAGKLQEQEQKIKDGELSLDPGEDAMTVVFGKENGSYLKGVGTGVTYTRYFHEPRTKGSSKAVIEELNFKLMNEKREVEKKDQQLEALSTKVTEQAKTLTQVLALLDSQGLKLPDLPSSPVSPLPQPNSVEKIVGSTTTIDTITTMDQPVTPPIQKKKKKVVESNTATTVPETPSDLPKAVTIEKKTTITDVPRTGTTDSQIVPKSIKCTLAYPDQRNIVALGEIHLSSERQVIHGVPLQDDCYKVSIEELRKPNSFLPFETGEYKTVGEAFKSFVAWPKYLVKCDPKLLVHAKQQMTSTQGDSEHQKSKKRSHNFCTTNSLQARAKSKRNIKKKPY